MPVFCFIASVLLNSSANKRLAIQGEEYVVEPVVCHDDTSRPDLFLQPVGYHGGCPAGGMVAGNYVPQDDGVFFFEVADLGGTNAAVGGAEEGAADDRIGPFDVFEIFFVRGGPAAEVAPGVVAYGMAFLPDAVEEGRVFLHLPSQAEEGGFGVMLRQPVEDAGCALRIGTVVEGEINLAGRRRQCPYQLRKQPADDMGRTEEKHEG